MVEYINLIGGSSGVSLQYFFDLLIAFFKTPEGWAFIAVIVVGFLVFKR